ncbi:MAG: hypothetical protein IJX99_00950 [Clostridia bacterium]|nr:hypothetical protein [Clostridia bacterium]
MINEELLREHPINYPIVLEKKIFDNFSDRFFSSSISKVSSRKKKIYITVEKDGYCSRLLRARIKARIDDVPCSIYFEFDYEKMKRGVTLFFTYKSVEYRPYTIPLTPRDDLNHKSYNYEIPFSIFITDDEKFISDHCICNYDAIKNNNTERVELLKSLYGDKYISDLEYYFTHPQKHYLIVADARVAAFKLVDRLIEFLYEYGSEE